MGREAKSKLCKESPSFKNVSESQLKMDLSLCYTQYLDEREKRPFSKDDVEEPTTTSNKDMQVSDGLDDYLKEQLAQLYRFMKQFDCPPYEIAEETSLVGEGDVFVERVVEVDPVEKYFYLL